jgi:hypothetical protein
MIVTLLVVVRGFLMVKCGFARGLQAYRVFKELKELKDFRV